MALDLRALLREFILNLVIFLFKTGEALLDSSLRPFITTAVCGDMYDGVGDPGPVWTPAGKGYVVHYKSMDSMAQNHRNNTDACANLHRLPEEISDQIQRQAAGIVVAYRILNCVPAVILGLFCGAWSDTRGRKLPMMVPSAGSCLAVVLYMLSMQVSHGKVAFLLGGAAFQGTFGKSSLIFMALSSHVSDTSNSEERTRSLGRLLGSTFLGVFLGSFLAGFLQDVSGLHTTLVIVSLCHVSSTLIVLLGVREAPACVKEEEEEKKKKKNDPNENEASSDSGYKELPASSSGDESSETSGGEGSERGGEGGGGGGDGGGEGGGGGKPREHGLFSWEGLRDSVMTVVKKRDGNKRSIIVISLTLLFLTQVLRAGDQDVTVLFVQQPPLSWPASYYGYLVAMDYGVMCFTLLVVLPVLTGLLDLADSHVVLLAILCKLVRSTWAGFCTRTWMMFTSTACGAFGGLINAGLRSILSKTADGGEVGKLFSIQASLETLAKLVGSGIFTGIYAATVDLYPPAAYLAELVVYLLMAALILWMGHLLRELRTPGLLLEEPKTYSSVSKVDEDLKDTLLPSVAETLSLSGEEGNGDAVNQTHEDKRHQNGCR